MKLVELMEKVDRLEREVAELRIAMAKGEVERMRKDREEADLLRRLSESYSAARMWGESR
jgi:hypothetical protein